MIFGAAIFGADKRFPNQTAAKAVRSIAADVANHVLKVPGRSRMTRNLELEQAKANLIEKRVRSVKHEDQHHAVRGPAVDAQ